MTLNQELGEALIHPAAHIIKEVVSTTAENGIEFYEENQEVFHETGRFVLQILGVPA